MSIIDVSLNKSKKQYEKPNQLKIFYFKWVCFRYEDFLPFPDHCLLVPFPIRLQQDPSVDHAKKENASVQVSAAMCKPTNACAMGSIIQPCGTSTKESFHKDQDCLSKSPMQTILALIPSLSIASCSS